MSKKPKAIALMSGGLDSTLAAKVVKDQGVEVIGLHLLSPFGCREDVEKMAEIVGIPLLIKEKGESYLDLVKNPRFGYGRHMNPCIDCRVFMFQLADVVRQDQGADFIVTGEVVGQRPMSQQRTSMDLIDRHSPAERLILRPLSANCLEPTIPEEEGWVKREEMYQIAGRSRTEQFELAEKLGIKDFKAPGGGCLLTEAGFSSRLRDFNAKGGFENSEQRMAQAEMLRLGRHFRLNDDTKIIIGRNQGENQELEKLYGRAGAVYFEPEDFTGPCAAVVGKLDESVREIVGGIILRYGKYNALPVLLREERAGTTETFQISKVMAEAELENWRL